MRSFRFTAQTSSDGVVERDFVLGDITGVLWPGDAHSALVLMGHGGGQHKKAPGILSRARHMVRTHGFTVVAIDAPGHGDRPRTEEDDRARADLRQAVTAGDTGRVAVVSGSYGAALAHRAVPEWQEVLDALQRLPEIGAETPIGYGGGIALGTGIGIPLTAADSRIRAAIFGGGFAVDEPLLAAAARITVPVQFLLPWDDEHVDRRSALTLFDAFASQHKTLHANPGDHRTIRWLDLDDGFLARHLAPTRR